MNLSNKIKRVIDARDLHLKDLYDYLVLFHRDNIHKEVVKTKCELCGEIKPCAFKKPTQEIYACEECMVVDAI